MDDEEARRRTEDGGIGYMACCPTVQGMCAQVVDWNKWVEEEEMRMEKDEKKKKDL